MNGYPEPTHDRAARTTATSKAEGRLKVSVAGRRKRKRKILKNKLQIKYK